MQSVPLDGNPAHAGLPEDLPGLSREFLLRCARDGKITWADERARRLGFQVGANLSALVAPGAEDKLTRLLQATDESAAWELILQLSGEATVLAIRFRVTPAGELAWLGSSIPDEYGRVLSEVAANASELAALHRETDRQQRELLRRHDELVRLHRELEESYRGVVALHAEIGDKEESLLRAGQVKTRLVANVSHEFRTPLNSILGLSRLLLSRADGELNEEQQKQLGFIQQSAQSLYELVNDLLDLSKLEANKAALHSSTFQVNALFSALRGMLRPLEINPDVQLVFDAPEEPIELETDESKLVQILRNLISNALKFTEQGEVRVAATQEGKDVVMRVSDTGIGIAPEHQDLIFEEFFQVDGPVQRKVKGTGLGLSLSRHLAERLAGELTLQSELGKGTTFTLRVPARHPEVSEMQALVERSQKATPGQAPVLVIEDDRQTLFLYEKYLRGSGFHVIPARTLDDARAAMRRIRPAAVVMDIMLEGEASWSFLSELKQDPATREIPTLVVTVTNREDKARALGADEFFMKPVEQEWLIGRLRGLARREGAEKVLVIDDDHVSRYLIRKHLDGTEFTVLEAAGGAEGVRLAREQSPQLILLDFVMPEMSAFDVLDELKKDPVTRNIPVVIHTSKTLDEDERKRLNAEASAILSKQSLSREIAIARIREALQKSLNSGAVKGQPQ